MSESRQPNGMIGQSVRPPSPPGRQAALVIFLVVLSAGLTLYRTAERDLFTAHEARAARVARHMLEPAGWPADKPSPWLVPQFAPNVRAGLNYQKPPLYYWAVAAVSLPLGEVTALGTRLPSAVSMVLLVVVTFHLGKALVSVRTGFIAALVLASTPKILWWSRAAILDPMLAVCIAGSLLFFFRAHRGLGGAWQYWLFWALAGLGTLVKATALVVPLMVFGLYLLSRARAEGFWGPLWRAKPISGPLVLLAVGAPWHILAHVATGGEFSRIYWGTHVFGRATGTSVFEDTSDPWYYLLAIGRDLFPWVVFLPGALVQPWRRASREHLGRMLFPYVWFAGSFVFFSAVSFRKDEYLLVAYPAAALLIGYFLDYTIHAHAEDTALRRWVTTGFVVVAAAALLLGGGLLAVALVPAFRQFLLGALHNATDHATFTVLADLLADRTWMPLLLVGPMMAGAAVSVVLMRRGRPSGAVTLTLCTTVLAFVLFVHLVVPPLNQVRGMSAFARCVEGHAMRAGRDVPVFLAVEECHELAFLLHRRAVGLEEQPDVVGHLTRELAAGRPWLVVMARKSLERKRWPGLAWHVVAETFDGHCRPMVLCEPRLGT